MEESKEQVEKKEIIIPIETIQDEFKQSLDTYLNKRIFLNGKYGTGKTYFLKKFFEKYEKDYEVFYLLPVHYQVHENRDIAEIIKYDLLVELQNKNSNIFEIKEGVTIAEELGFLVNLIKKKIDVKSIIKSFLNRTQEVSIVEPTAFLAASILGKTVDTVFKFDEELQEEIAKELSEQDSVAIKDFIERITKLKINANDYLDLIIVDAIREVSGKEKRSVLVIDDLDRLDPDHLFRILNIFSSQFNLDDSNKYNFDHVIITGDKNNVESIFKHKYGVGTDFDGYFDKFFSTTPFDFDNKRAIISSFSEIGKRINFGDGVLQKSFDRNELSIIFEILNKAVELNVITLRGLLKSTKTTLLSIQEGAYDRAMNRVKNTHSVAILSLATRLLIDILGGDKQKLVDLVERVISEKVFKEFVWSYKYNHYEDLSFIMLRSFVPYLENGESGELRGKADDGSEEYIGYTIKDPKVFPLQQDQEVELFYRIFLRYLKTGEY